MNAFAARLLLSLAIAAACLSGAGTAAAAIRYAEDYYPQLRDLMQLSAHASSGLQMLDQHRVQRQADVAYQRAENRPQVRLHGRVAANYQTREDIDNDLRGEANIHLNATQNLFHWGNFQRREAIARMRAEMEQTSFTEHGSNHFMRLRRSYLEWLLMQQRRDILRRSIDLNSQFVEARRQLADAGQTAEQDVLEMEARLLENREFLAFIDSRIVDLEGILRHLVGPGFDPARLRRESLDQIEPLPAQAMRALEARVQRSAAADLTTFAGERWLQQSAIEAEQLEILQKQNWPMFQAVAGVFSDQLDGPNQRNSILRIQYYAGIQVNWHIFDSGLNNARKLGAFARLRAAELETGLAREQANQQANNLLARIELNRKQIEARSLREQLLERRVNLLREQIEQNLIPGTDLLEGEIQLLEVRQRLLEARVDYLMHTMELGLLLREDPALNLISPDAP